MAKSDWRQEAQERYKEKQQQGRFKLVEGENTIRILPRIGSKKSQAPFFEYLVHRDVGPNKRFVRCGKNLHGDGECWLCDKKIPDLESSGKSSKRQLAASLQAKEQFVVQVASVDPDSGKMTGPFLWAVSTGGARSLSARLLGVLKTPKRDYVDPVKGYNMTIERTGTGMRDTIYGQIITDEEPSEVPEKLLAKAKPFSSYVPAYSEEQQKAAYFGRDEKAEAADDEEEERDAEVETEEDEEEEGRPAPADEDEEEGAEPDEESEEDEDTPKKKKRPVDEDEEEEETPKSKKKKVEVDEDEGAEPEPDEDDEDEAPKAKKKKKASEDDEEEEAAEEDEEEGGGEEDADEEDEDAPKSKKGKKHVADEDEEEEEERPVRKAKKAKKPSSDDDDE